MAGLATHRLRPGSTVACGCRSEGQPCVRRPLWVAFTLLCGNQEDSPAAQTNALAFVFLIRINALTFF